MGVNVECTSLIYSAAKGDPSLMETINDDAYQCMHVIAKWHLDEVRAAANGPRPAPIFLVSLMAAHFPHHVDWAFSRYLDLEAITEVCDLRWWAETKMERPEYAYEAFHPPAGSITVFHHDQAYRDAVDVTKLIFFTMSFDVIEAYAEELAALPEHEQVFNPMDAHYDWELD